jgi:hypothetical protein
MSTDAQPEPKPEPEASLRFQIPVEVRQRVLLALLTPARLTQVFSSLEEAINRHGIPDAAITLEYVREGEVYGLTDLLPSVTFGVRKAQPDAVMAPPPPRLILPG